jgi:hypothetical protein
MNQEKIDQVRANAKMRLISEIMEEMRRGKPRKLELALEAQEKAINRYLSQFIKEKKKREEQ